MKKKTIQKIILFIAMLFGTMVCDLDQGKTSSGIRRLSEETQDSRCEQSLESLLNSKSRLPEQLQQFLKFIYPMLSESEFSKSSICLGVFGGMELFFNDQLVKGLCNTLPIYNKDKFHILSISLNNVQCEGVKETTDISLCMAYDSRDTVAMAFNGGLSKCLGIYSSELSRIFKTIPGKLSGIFTQIVKSSKSSSKDSTEKVVLMPNLASSMEENPNFSFGYSFGRKFIRQVTVAYNIDLSKPLQVAQVSSHGHFLFNTGINLTPNFKIGDQKLSDFFKVTGNIEYLVDFGGETSAITKVISATVTENFKDAEQIIIVNGKELTLTVDGVITLNLRSLTGGLFPDLRFTVIDAKVLISTGRTNKIENIQLAPGVYFSLDSNLVPDLINNLNAVLAYFRPVLDKDNAENIEFTPVDGKVSVFLNTEGFGVQFAFFKSFLKCIFSKDTTFNCSFPGKTNKENKFISFSLKEQVIKFILGAKKTGLLIAEGAANLWRDAAKNISNKIKSMDGFIETNNGILVGLLSDEYNKYMDYLRGSANKSLDLIKKVPAASTKYSNNLRCFLKYVWNRRIRAKCLLNVDYRYDYETEYKISDISRGEREYQKTDWVSDQDGAITSLVEQKVECGENMFVTNLKLERKDSNLRYRYECIELDKPTNTIETDPSKRYGTDLSQEKKKVTFISKGENAPVMDNPHCRKMTSEMSLIHDKHENCNFDKIQMSCFEGFALKNFKMKTFVNEKNFKNLYFLYTCCQVPHINPKCIDSNDSEKLGKLNISTDKNTVLTSIKLSKENDNWQYTYTSCPIQETQMNVKESYISNGADIKSKIFTPIEVNCKDKGGAINNFRLKQIDNIYKYEYTCVKSDKIVTTEFHENQFKKTTHLADLKKGSSVNCETDGVLTYFDLSRDPKTLELSYKYYCHKLSNSKLTKSIISKDIKDEFSSVDVDAGSFNALIQFKLIEQSYESELFEKSYYYEYKYADLNNKEQVSSENYNTKTRELSQVSLLTESKNSEYNNLRMRELRRLYLQKFN